MKLSVSRLILEADSELERGAAVRLQVDGLELARLRAIVRDLAEQNRLIPNSTSAVCASAITTGWVTKGASMTRAVRGYEPNRRYSHDHVCSRVSPMTSRSGTPSSSVHHPGAADHGVHGTPAGGGRSCN